MASAKADMTISSVGDFVSLFIRIYRSFSASSSSSEFLFILV